MRALFLSYDGLSDGLGQSQVIPYLEGLAGKGHALTVISLEKKRRYQELSASLWKQLKSSHIEWYPLPYHARPPVLGPIWNTRQMRRQAIRLHAVTPFSLIHCRGYLSALVGHWFYKNRNVPFLFDMRGFFADERVDGGLWSKEHWLYGKIYRYFKKKEKIFLRDAAHCISLTHAGKKEILSWQSTPTDLPIDVIPCTVDTDRFTPENIRPEKQSEWRRRLNLSKEQRVITYLGSLGTWYLLDEMLQCFQILHKRHPNAVFLFITPDDPGEIYRRAKHLGIPSDSLRVQSAHRNEVPELLSLSQLGLFFIKPAYSKKASSATKLGEFLSMGIPVIANTNVGDQNRFFEDPNIGLAVSEFSQSSYLNVAEQLDDLSHRNPDQIRSKAKTWFSLQDGVEKYHQVYREIEQRSCP